MKILSLYEIEECLHQKARLQCRRPLKHAQRSVRHCLIDSRNMHSPQDSLFFALRTKSNDGHKYLSTLYQRGARAFVVMSLPSSISDFPDADFLLVDDTLKALQSLASWVRNLCKAPLLAIAGSNGKTIVKEWIWQLLKDDCVVTRSPGSYNSQIGVPLSLMQLDEETQLAVIEAGISQKGEMQTLEKLIAPRYALLTNIASPHQENFASWQEKLEEKCQLFKACECIIYPGEEADLALEMNRLFPAKRLLASSYRDIPAEALAAFPYDDAASLQNIGHAYCFCRLFLKEFYPEKYHDYFENGSSSVSFWKSKLASIEAAPMRLELKEGKKACVLINDTYNSDVQALSLALDFQARRADAQQMSRSLILSDIYESGKSASDLYAEIASLIATYKIQRFVGVGSELCRHAQLFPASSRFFLSTEDLLACDLLNEFSHELVLIKASRRFGFERVTEALALKTHQTRMEVNLNAIVHNYRYFRSLLKPATKLIAMVKADAYGLGAVEISKTLQAQGCDAVAVAVVDEGIALRQAGISIPILVMNPDVNVLPLCYEYHLEPEIYSFALLRSFLQAGQRLGVSHYPIHLKLDTGMHRLGFTQEDLPALIALLQSQKTLMLSSVFTHLAGSDEARLDDYTQAQWLAFEAMSSRLREAFPYEIDRHILNSAGIERFPQWQCERVRLGIGLYGIATMHQSALMQVASFKTHILQLHHYGKGESIGYGRQAYLQRDSVVATIPVGYADGFSRHNKGGVVLVNGYEARLLGNICMDACMVDVTNIPVKEGDTVEIFGDKLTISHLAARCETIPYEILTSVSQRVKRVYFHE